MGLKYEEVDPLLFLLVDNRYSPEDCVAVGFDPALVDNVISRVRRSQFKRLMPPIAKLSNRTVGYDFLYEPSRKDLLGELGPKHIAIQVWRALLDSVASEHGARMTAMESATKNAEEMIGKLTLQYNRARQAYVTKELMEIVSGAEALK